MPPPPVVELENRVRPEHAALGGDRAATAGVDRRRHGLRSRPSCPGIMQFKKDRRAGGDAQTPALRRFAKLPVKVTRASVGAAAVVPHAGASIVGDCPRRRPGLLVSGEAVELCPKSSRWRPPSRRGGCYRWRSPVVPMSPERIVTFSERVPLGPQGLAAVEPAVDADAVLQSEAHSCGRLVAVGRYVRRRLPRFRPGRHGGVARPDWRLV